MFLVEGLDKVGGKKLLYVSREKFMIVKNIIAINIKFNII
tara:strand:+ start:129 stop:248 length:120 start_codon:yes stop_codon:yes gene_type:complete